jgi:hypothetical protein
VKLGSPSWSLELSPSCVPQRPLSFSASSRRPFYACSQMSTSAVTEVVVDPSQSWSLLAALMAGGVEQQHFRLRSSAPRETKVYYLTRTTLQLTSGHFFRNTQRKWRVKTETRCARSISLSVDRRASQDDTFGRLGARASRWPQATTSFVPLACLKFVEQTVTISTLSRHLPLLLHLLTQNHRLQPSSQLVHQLGPPCALRI